MQRARGADPAVNRSAGGRLMSQATMSGPAAPRDRSGEEAPARRRIGRGGAASDSDAGWYCRGDRRRRLLTG